MPAGSMGDGRAAPDLTGGRMLTLRMERVNTASRAARRHLREELGDLDHETLDVVLLIATELVTNAVLHAVGPIDLTTTVTSEDVLIQVFDCEPLPPLVREHDLDRTNGRGIALVSMISADWGTRYHDGGKTVWAVVRRPDATD